MRLPKFVNADKFGTVPSIAFTPIDNVTKCGRSQTAGSVPVKRLWEASNLSKTGRTVISAGIVPLR